MKETKLYWYHNTAYSMDPYFVCLHFPNVVESPGAQNGHLVVISWKVSAPVMSHETSSLDVKTTTRNYTQQDIPIRSYFEQFITAAV